MGVGAPERTMTATSCRPEPDRLVGEVVMARAWTFHSHGSARPERTHRIVRRRPVPGFPTVTSELFRIQQVRQEARAETRRPFHPAAGVLLHRVDAGDVQVAPGSAGL